MNQFKPRILIVFYSMYGHVFRMAKAIAEGVQEARAESLIRQVAELIPKESWNEGIKKAKETMKNIPSYFNLSAKFYLGILSESLQEKI